MGIAQSLLLMYLFYISLKVAEYLVDLLKAGKGAGMAFDDLHHLTNLPLVDDAHQHMLVGVRIHTVDPNLRNTVSKAGHQFFREHIRLICDDLEFIAVFYTAETVIHNNIGDKEVH